MFRINPGIKLQTTGRRYQNDRNSFHSHWEVTLDSHWEVQRAEGFSRTSSYFKFFFLWVKKARGKDKTYVWGSVWWKTQKLKLRNLRASHTLEKFAPFYLFFIMNQESESYRQDLYMRIGVMKDSKTKVEDSTRLTYTGLRHSCCHTHLDTSVSRSWSTSVR